MSADIALLCEQHGLGYRTTGVLVHVLEHPTIFAEESTLERAVCRVLKERYEITTQTSGGRWVAMHIPISRNHPIRYADSDDRELDAVVDVANQLREAMGQ